MTIAGRAPNFVYVGGSKCGSSWLYEILREHPQVFVPSAKDVMYFDRHYDRSLDWYLSFFSLASSSQVAVGELTHDYFLYPDIAGRIYSHFPEAKIIACLREPADRTVSRWIYERSIRLGAEVSFSEFMKRPETLRENSYLANLEPYFARFKHENILILFYDEIVANPQQLASRLYGFLGADDTFVPPSLHKRVLPAREARIETLAHMAYSFAQLMRRTGKANVVGAVKRNSIFETLLYRPLKKRPEVALADLNWIRERFTDDYSALARMIGRELPSSWYSR